MFSNDQIPTQAECEQYFLEHGVRAERGAAFWQHESQFNWRSKFPLLERAQRWIDNSRPYERLRPDEFAPTHRLEPFPVPPRESPDPNLIPMPVHMRKHKNHSSL